MLKDRAWTIGIGLLLICVSFAMGSCDTRVTPTVIQETNKAEFLRDMRTLSAECNQLPKEKIAQCEGMSARLIANFEAYIQEHNGELDPDRVTTMELEIEAAMRSIPGLFREAGVSTEATCKVSDIGWVQCVRLADMLAEYDSDFAALILLDIEQLYEVLGLDVDKRVLVGCGRGTWGATTPEEVGADSSEEMLENLNAYTTAMLDFCVGVRGEAQGSGWATGGPSGFSGLTGFDPFGMFNACGLEISNPSVGETMASLFASMDSWHASCEQTIQSSFMGGGKPPADGGGESKPPATAPPTKKAKMTGQANDAVIESQQTVTLTDGSTSEITYYSDGTTEFITTNADGNQEVRYDYSDGTSEFVQTDADGNITKEGTHGSGDDFETIYHDGYTETIYGDGTRKILLPDGSSAYEDEYGGAHVYDQNGNYVYTIFNPVWEINDCLDETCRTCAGFSSLIPQLFTECLGSSGASFLCQAFGQEADCCADSSSPGDPRLVIPDPQGNFACTAAGVYSPADLCRERCGVASFEENCTANCASITEAGLIQFDALDAICQFAIWEACFQGDLPFDLGGVLGDGGPGRGGPLPAPALEAAPDVLEHLIFSGFDPRDEP